VKSDFVKDFIADALSADNNKIDLRQNKRNIEYLTKHYEDIRVFLDPKNLQTVESIAKLFSEMQFNKIEQKETAVSLGKMLKYSESQVEEINQVINQYQAQVQDIDLKISTHATDYEQKVSIIREKIGAIKAKIYETERKEKSYESIDIEFLLKEQMKEEHYNEQIELKQEEYKLFSRDFQDIENAFAERERELKHKEREILAGFEQKNRDLQAVKKEEEDAVKKQMQVEYERLKADVQEELDALREDIKNCDIESVRLKGDQRVIQATTPREAEILHLEMEVRNLKTSIQNADSTLRQNKQSLQYNEAQMETIREKFALKKEQMVRDIEKSIQKYKNTIEEIQVKLDTVQHTLYGFLSQNVPDWRDTIGKVCREEILFSDSLSPDFSSQNADSFFGLRLDLSNIEPIAKTMEEYQAEQNEAREQIRKCKADIIQAEDTCIAEEQNALKPLRESTKSLIAEIQALEAQLISFNKKTELYSAQLDDLNIKSEAQKKAEILANREALIECEQKKDQLNYELVQKNNALAGKISLAATKETAAIATIEEKYQSAIDELSRQQSEILQDIDNQRETIKEQLDKDLSDKGVDSHLLDNIQKEIDKLQAKLRSIQQNLPKVISYRRDKEEFFDCKDTFIVELADFTEKDISLKNEFDEIKQRFLAEKQEIEVRRAEIFVQQQEYSADIKYYNTQIKSNSGLCFEFQTEIESQTAENVYQSIQEIGAKLVDLYNKQKDNLFKFNTDVKKYANLFQEDNILGFSNSFDSNADYEAFARKITDFIQEQKIKEYIRSVNKGYALAVESIARDITNLTGQEEGVKRIIGDVEQEFTNAQFGDTGLIESIEIRPVETENEILKKLKKAALHFQEHLAERNEQTLFSVAQNEFVVENRDTKMIKLLSDVKEAIDEEKDKKIIGVKDLFEIEFRIKEGSNDSGWVKNLKNIGSEGTDILVKAIINITLLHSFVKKAINTDHNFRLHCIIDEIGKISRPLMIQLIKFAADRNIYLINGLPNESGIETSYKYTYKLSKIGARKIVTKQLQIEVEV
jgi:hypothetical protein